MYLARSSTRSSAHSGCTLATAATTPSTTLRRRDRDAAEHLAGGGVARVELRGRSRRSLGGLAHGRAHRHGDYRCSAPRPGEPAQARGQLRLGLVGLVEALAGDALGQQLLGGEVSGVAVRVVIAAALLPRPRTRAQPCRHGRGAVLAHVALAPPRAPARRRLTWAPETGRWPPGRARSAPRAARRARRPRRRGGHRESAGVGVADVLGGEDHHAPDDEARVLAALEHDRQVVQRGVRVRAARGLDPGGDVVVVAVSLFVVQDRPSLQGVLGPRERHALSPSSAAVAAPAPAR